jgi:hypothetical protein
MLNFLSSNLNVKICAIYKNNKLYNLHNLFVILFRFIPFYISSYIFNLFGYQIIYMTNNIYNLTYTNSIHIIPIILKFNIIYDTNTFDLTNIIKNYSTSIPLKFIIKQNNINKYNKIELIFLQNGKKISKIKELFDINIPIYKLFLNLDTE